MERSGTPQSPVFCGKAAKNALCMKKLIPVSLGKSMFIIEG
jgi:hypothetical protein